MTRHGPDDRRRRQQLAVPVAGGREARLALASVKLRLVISLAQSYVGDSLGLPALVGEGALAT